MSTYHKQLLSYLVTFAVYCSFLPWQAVIILMVGIGFHECGHLWAAKRLRIPTNGFFLFPFFGGMAIVASEPRKYTDKVFLYLMGPVAGGILALATYILYLVTGSMLVGQAAMWMVWLNLFNLLPFSIMDGGQIFESIVYSINETFGLYATGVSLVVALPILWFLNPILALFMAIFGGMNFYSRYQEWKIRRHGLFQLRPKKMNWKQIVGSIAATLVTALILVSIFVLLDRDAINFLHMFQ